VHDPGEGHRDPGHGSCRRHVRSVRDRGHKSSGCRCATTRPRLRELPFFSERSDPGRGRRARHVPRCEVSQSREAGVRITTHGKPGSSARACGRARRRGARRGPGRGSFDELTVVRCGRTGVVVERGGDPLLRRSKISISAARASSSGRAVAGVSRTVGSARTATRDRDLLRRDSDRDGVQDPQQRRPGVSVLPQGGGVVEKCEIVGNRGGAWARRPKAAYPPRKRRGVSGPAAKARSIVSVASGASPRRSLRPRSWPSRSARSAFSQREKNEVPTPAGRLRAPARL